MPRLRPKSPKGFDPEAIVVCWMPFSSAAHPEVIIAGTRLRGDHPAVVANPQFFHADGLADDEKPDPFVSFQQATEPVVDAELSLLAEPREYHPAEIAVATATRSIRVAIGTDPKTGLPERVTTIRRGARFLSLEPLVQNLPSAFAIERFGTGEDA